MLKLFNTTKHKHKHKHKNENKNIFINDCNKFLINNTGKLYKSCKKYYNDNLQNITPRENICNNEKKYCDINSFHTSNKIIYNYTKRYSYKNLDELIRHRDSEYRYFNTIEIVIMK